MIRPNPDLARRTLLRYHDFVSDLKRLEYLDNICDMSCESETRKLERALVRLEKDHLGRNSLSHFSDNYKFNFRIASNILRAIKNDEPYSDSQMKEFCKSIPTIQEFVTSASVAFA